MDTRPLEATGHDSTIATFGTIALNWFGQEGVDQLADGVRAPLMAAADRLEADVVEQSTGKTYSLVFRLPD